MRTQRVFNSGLGLSQPSTTGSFTVNAQSAVLQRARWRKSSYSGNNGTCVEVADLSRLQAIRDSKDPTGPILTFAVPQVAAVLADIRRGKLLS